MIKENNQKNKKENLDIEDLPKVWNEYAKVNEKLFNAPVFKEILKIFRNAIFPCPGGIVHVGGCGIGYNLSEILEKTQASKIIATDISSEMIKKAKERVSKLSKEYQNKIEFQQIDLSKNWPKGNFDAQIFQLLSNYLPYKGWHRIIEMAYKTMKDNGHIYSSEFLRGLNISEVAKKHTFEQMLHTPISSFPAMLKSSKILKCFDLMTENNIIQLGSKEEYLNYYKSVGFKNIEIVGEIFWGVAVVIRAQK